MKPTNLDGKGCDPMSSNCVIYQGPDIECLQLCKGDNVSDVFNKMALELCGILETLSITPYDFSCLNITDCEPETFQELFQLLIERICALENVDPATAQGTGGCPDCIVTVSSCFFFQNELGDTVQTMQLVDYVTAIGNRICDILQTLIEIDATLDDHENRLGALETQQGGLQAQFLSAIGSQTVVPKYVLTPGVPTPIDQVLSAVEEEFGQLRIATGYPTDIYNNLVKQLVGLSTLPQLAGLGNMGSIPGWTEPLTNAAEAIGNILLVQADIRAAILNLQATLPAVCDAVTVQLSAALDNPLTLKLFFTGTLPTPFTECDPLGTNVTIMDAAGGTLVARVPIEANMNNATGFTIDLTSTPVNGLDDLTITTSPCFRDAVTGTQCQSFASYFLNNVLACPSVILTPTDTTIQYQFNHTGTEAASYLVELFDSSGTSLLASQTEPVSGPATVTGTFIGLTPDIDYKIKVTVTQGTTVTECPFSLVTTLPSPCTPPGGVSATIIP